MSTSTVLDGRVAIITGAGSGIGRAMATTFAAAGATVVAADIAADSARSTTLDIERDGGRATAVEADVGDEAAVENLVREVVDAHGRIDVLCNNAGIMDTMALPENIPTELWDRVLRLNLTGPFLLTRAVLPHMLANGHGRVVNTASEAGLRGGAAGTAYTASKHGVIGLTRNLAWTHARDGIRCNAICPGPVSTNVSGGEGKASFDTAGIERLAPVLALGEQMAEPQAIADVALFLASEQSSFVNGAVLPADGGWSAA
ncbi:NAD(P)-dependent dehydrogenase (short-subunit alcohol dehydrogenase family) [Saccharopolyspora lacisalsi]|uniref:NAD(P)-dependent dehydrogenase (Short-subunit alcohol dehydrogenase family) n=1 Tax=Halosaccharopolyspora lacisalsi TaxID=1000566 RepID=A0A839E3T3_9PSEU|nr:SDR family oxidoreductase [Halosaccharopolyspora lacisalsi]MBA8826435.1 NAD(P)-dependent dehydrogenase (short-subunit alcohol dehydrogenase family) [Halosaccharopolyspora lacisalsi]